MSVTLKRRVENQARKFPRPATRLITPMTVNGCGMSNSVETERQEQLVLYGYLIQWSMLVMPPMFLVSLVYGLVLRLRVMHFELRTHVKWQLATCIITLVALAVGFLLLIVALSGFNTDSIWSVIATFTAMAGSAVFLPWLLYRLVYGNLRFSQQVPMRSVLP